MDVFILDANFFIQAHRINYPLDVATGFWKKVKDLSESGKIISIDKVKNEIFENEDALTDWIKKNLPEKFFVNTNTAATLTNYANVARWANSKNTHYLPQAISEFLDADNADAWLVAYALSDATQNYIITQEISEPNKKSKIKIPDVCIHFGIKYANTIELFRKLGETF
jgi:hypothetical protein